MTILHVYPSDDSYTDSDNPDTNYGSNNYIYVEQTTQYGFFQYDISIIPANAVIDSVYCIFDTDNVIQDTTVTLYSVIPTFDESTITWNNQPASEQLSKTFLVKSGNWISGPDITSIFLSWLSNVETSEFRVELRNDDNSDVIPFASKELSANGNLYIDYHIEYHYYVKTTGDDSKDGLSWTNAWATINKAATTAIDNSTVHIGHGTYNNEPAGNTIAPVNAASLGIKYKPETADTGAEVAGSVIIEKN